MINKKKKLPSAMRRKLAILDISKFRSVLRSELFFKCHVYYQHFLLLEHDH